MFGIKKLKSDNVKLSNQVAELQQKSTELQHDIISYSVPLYDFNKKDEIRKAIDTVPELASILNYLCNSFSVGKYHIQKKGEDVENNILNILQNPNILQNETEFKQSYLESIIGFGVAYIYINTIGLPEFTKSISILDADKTSAYVGKLTQKELLESNDLNNVIKYFEYSKNGEKFKINSSNIIIISSTNAEIKNKYITFKSPLKPLEKALQVTPAMYDSMQNLMNNGGMKGFVSNKSKNEYGSIEIDEKEKKELQKAFKNYGSKSNQHDIAFTNSELNYIPITSRIKDMLLPEQQNMIKTIISDVLGFDTAILNSNNANKYKSTDYQEARKSMYQEKLIPIANNLTENLSSYFFKYSEEKIILDYSDIDVFSEDEKTKSEKISVESIYIINLNKSVSLNEMSRDSAIEFLIINGYDEETAKKLI